MSAVAARTARGREVARRSPSRGRPTGMLARTVRSLQVRRFAVVFVVLLALAMAKVWIGLQMTELGYQLSDLRKEQLRLEEYRQQLEVELATQQSRAALDQRARRTLGMITPKRGQVVDIR
jgi:cell division protein FtsL